MSGYPTLAERIAIARSGGRLGEQLGFPPPGEPREVTAGLQAIYDCAPGRCE